MTTPLIRLIGFGSARALTRDLIGGIYTEMNVFDSREPAGV